MHITCPTCHDRFPIAAGFLEDDGKRLAALLADMEPVLGRAVIGYLRLFKPAKQGLRTARAVKLVQSLDELVREGTVCKDERGGVRRPATPAMWAEGIEQMLTDHARLSLPLGGHNYLRTVVFGIANQADAAVEQARERHRREGRHLDAPVRTNQPSTGPAHSPLYEALQRIDADLHLGLIETPEEAERRRAEACKQFGKGP
jgi:hypothetical protein